MRGDPPQGSRKGKTCETKWCRTPKAIKSNGYLLSHCWKCRSRMLARKHPITYVLNAMRGSARKRSLPFTITKEQFADWCKQTGYLEKRGKEPTSLTVDRVDHRRGYHIDNIKATPHALNSRMGFCVPGLTGIPQNQERSEMAEQVPF